MAARQAVYTVDEANALIPRVRAILLQLAVEQRRLAAAATEMTEAREGIRGLLGLLEQDGIVLRDAEMGLIDFPAERDGEAVWLCWRLSDPRVAHWHGTNEGYASRRPW
jgi:hypothetical protein